MYYVKTRINDELEVRIDLTGDNVFTTCPNCGAEFKAEISQYEDFCLYGTRTYCDECIQKTWEGHDAD